MESYCSLAVLREKQGAYENAESLYRRALFIAETILGKNHDRAKSISAALAYLRGKQEKKDRNPG